MNDIMRRNSLESLDSGTSTASPTAPDAELTSLNWLLQPIDDLCKWRRPSGSGTDFQSELMDVPPTTGVVRDTVIVDPKGSDVVQSGRKRSIDNTQPNVDYSTTPVKPPYSYAQLITLAFHAQPEKMLTLTEIYSYIRQQFAYYRQGGDGWQNSIRHNLSLNKQFVRVARVNPREKGKGSYWLLDERRLHEKATESMVQQNEEQNVRRKGRPPKNSANSSAAPMALPFDDLMYAHAQPPLPPTLNSGNAYQPLHELMVSPSQTGQDGANAHVKVEYNWQGYLDQYCPAQLQSAMLPLQNQQAISAQAQSTEEAPQQQQQLAPLRIPTPEWWASQVTNSASLLSPPTGTQSCLARVFENLIGSDGTAVQQSAWMDSLTTAAHF